MKIKEYNQMMSYLTRKKPEKSPEQQVKDFSPKKYPVQQHLPGLSPKEIEKTVEMYDDPVVEKRGKQTEALINTTNKHLKDQIKKGNIKKEDLLLKEDPNGLMVNKNRTIAMRDSFMAKQFNRALDINEPQATPEQVGKLAERLERNAQMTGGMVRSQRLQITWVRNQSKRNPQLIILNLKLVHHYHQNFLNLPHHHQSF